MFKQVDNILLSKNVYLNLPVWAEYATKETLNDPFLGLCLMYAAKPLYTVIFSRLSHFLLTF